MIVILFTLFQCENWNYLSIFIAVVYNNSNSGKSNG